MKIVIGCDEAAYDLKEEIKKYLEKAPLLQMGGNHSLIYYV